MYQVFPCQSPDFCISQKSKIIITQPKNRGEVSPSDETQKTQNEKNNNFRIDDASFHRLWPKKGKRKNLH